MMGYFWGMFDRQQQNRPFGYFPCAPGCQGSRSDPRSCDCRCQGINHGCLVFQRPIRPIPAPMEYLQSGGRVLDLLPPEPLALPGPGPEPTREPEKPIETIYPIIGRKVAKAFRIAVTGHPSEANMNENILKGLRNQFNEENTETAIDQAFQVYYQRMGSDTNRPELYELYENGDLDKGLEHLGKRWVIGRPKRYARKTRN